MFKNSEKMVFMQQFISGILHKIILKNCVKYLKPDYRFAGRVTSHRASCQNIKLVYTRTHCSPHSVCKLSEGLPEKLQKNADFNRPTMAGQFPGGYQSPSGHRGNYNSPIIQQHLNQMNVPNQMGMMGE